jgi:hypothetical protein
MLLYKHRFMLSVIPPDVQTRKGSMWCLALLLVCYMNSACIVCIAGGLDGRRPSKKNPRMHALLQEIILFAGAAATPIDVVPVSCTNCCSM